MYSYVCKTRYKKLINIMFIHLIIYVFYIIFRPYDVNKDFNYDK